jgi:beta-lactamase regulating signal transducer with metallopeptidase domain
MTQLHRILILYLLNSLWQAPLLYLAAFLATKLLRRSSPVLQHRIWLTTLFLCLTIPLLSAESWLGALIRHIFLPTHPVNKIDSDSILSATQHTTPFASASHSAFSAFTPANVLLLLWAVAILFRALQIAFAYRRIVTITRLAHPPRTTSAQQLLRAATLRAASAGSFQILFSADISMPATTGIRTPIVLLPSAIVASASTEDLDALLAHEYAHIARKDFRQNLLYELIAIPLSYHPAMRGIFASISHTRELICDSMAASKTGDPVAYARSLVSLSELLLQPTTSTAPALGLFDGHKLEKRIMSLLNIASQPTRTRTATLAILSLAIFVPCCVAAASYTFQPSALVAPDLQPFAGRWHWMFKGQPFVTMELVPAGDHFTGYMTNGFFSNDADGNMTEAGSQPGRSPIIRTFFSGNTLHIIAQDDKDKSLTEWAMTLVDAKTAQFSVADPNAPTNLKPWTAERVVN